MSADQGDPRPLCPSARCKPGSLLLGIVQPHGEIGFLQTPLVVSESFLAIAKQGRMPEARFRFSSPCLRTGCDKWNGQSCGVAATAAGVVGSPEMSADTRPPPHCLIRDNCQWFAEHGELICKACRWVITERPDASAHDTNRVATGTCMPDDLSDIAGMKSPGQ